MTEAQRNRWDVKLIFYIFNILYVLLFFWNIVLIGFIAAWVDKITGAIIKFLINIRYNTQQLYIRLRHIEMDGKIGSESKYWKGK